MLLSRVASLQPRVCLKQSVSLVRRHMSKSVAFYKDTKPAANKQMDVYIKKVATINTNKIPIKNAIDNHKIEIKNKLPQSSNHQAEKQEISKSKTQPAIVTQSNDEYSRLVDSLDVNKVANESVDNLLILCQKLNKLFDKEPSLAVSFKSKCDIEKEITRKFATHLNDLKTRKDDLISILEYALRIDKPVGRLEPLIYGSLTGSDGKQIIKVINLFRSNYVQLTDKHNISMKYIYLFENMRAYQSLNDVTDIFAAMKLFSKNASIVQHLDEKILRMSDSLTIQNWMDLFNLKSILRQRNINILQSCASRVIQLDKDMKALELANIQQALLSSGILTFFDDKFYTHLLSSLKCHLSSAKVNELTMSHLDSIINSMGIIQIRDPITLNHLTKFIGTKCIDSFKLISNLITSCGFLNFKPDVNEFKQIVSKCNASLDKFDRKTNRGKLALLNYVWSTCVLDCVDNAFIKVVLDENFWFSLQQEKNFKKTIQKLIHINLYSTIYLNDYNGPLLSELSVEKYKEILKGETNSLNQTLESTLSSFKSIDKYFKLNLLTSHGIVVDALCIVDKSGEPQPLSNHFDDNMKLTISNNEFVVAFKLMGYKDLTHVDKVKNGSNAMQHKLLDSLGYYIIPVTHEELKSQTVIIDRVKLIKNKLKNLNLEN